VKKRAPFAPVKPVVGTKEKKVGPAPVRPWVRLGEWEHPGFRMKPR